MDEADVRYHTRLHIHVQRGLGSVVVGVTRATPLGSHGGPAS